MPGADGTAVPAAETEEEHSSLGEKGTGRNLALWGQGLQRGQGAGGLSALRHSQGKQSENLGSVVINGSFDIDVRGEQISPI